jgi:hypothetical protein
MIEEISQMVGGVVSSVAGPFTAVVAICALFFNVLEPYTGGVSPMVMLALLVFGIVALLAVAVMFAILVVVQRTTSPDT